MTAAPNERAPSLTERVAEEIRATMGRRRISGARLARALGVSDAWISYRLSGKQPIDLNDLERICAVLAVQPTKLVVMAEERATQQNGSYVTVPERPTAGAVTSANRPANRPADKRPVGGPRPGRGRPELVVRKPLAA